MSLGVEMFYYVLPKDIFAYDCQTLTKIRPWHEPMPLSNPHFEATSCQMFQSGRVYGVWFRVLDSIQNGISYKIVAFLKCHPYWNSFSAFHCWWWHFIGHQPVSFIKCPPLDVCLEFAHLDGSCLSGRRLLLQTAPCPRNTFSGFLLFGYRTVCEASPLCSCLSFSLKNSRLALVGSCDFCLIVHYVCLIVSGVGASTACLSPTQVWSYLLLIWWLQMDFFPSSVVPPVFLNVFYPEK